MDKKLLIIPIIILVLILFFYPKPMENGGLCGLVAADATAYQENYKCLGIEHQPAIDCVDCCVYSQCFGLAYGKTCYMEGMGELTPTECN
jgi:hypothetical protein